MLRLRSRLLTSSWSRARPLLVHSARGFFWGKAPPPGRWNNLRTARSATDGAHHWLAWPAEPRTALHLRAPGQPPVAEEEPSHALEQALSACDEAAPPSREEELSPDQAEALKALGYLDDR